jgi:hypothetical protein
MRPKLRLLSLLMMMMTFCAWALAQDASTGAFAGLVSVNVSLKGNVSSRDAKAGQIVMTTVETPATVGGTVLPRGTMLIGHVVDVIKHSKETPDGLISILFDQAKPKKGEPINIRGSIFKIMLSDANLHAQNTDTASGMRGAAGTDMNTAVMRSNIDQNNHTGKGMQSVTDAPVQVMSTIHGVALSAVAGDDKSGIMTAKNQDVDLPASMDLVIGVALKQ